MVTRGYYEQLNLEEVKEKFPAHRQSIESYTPITPIEESVSKNDDRFLSKTWGEAYKFAAYYYDNPSLNDRFIYFNKFRFNFHGLLQKTQTPAELPDLRSRKDLVSWVCKKHNEYLEKEEGNFRVDCSDVNALISTYGPNYGNVKGMLGEYEFYY